MIVIKNGGNKNYLLIQNVIMLFQFIMTGGTTVAIHIKK